MIPMPLTDDELQQKLDELFPEWNGEYYDDPPLISNPAGLISAVAKCFGGADVMTAQLAIELAQVDNLTLLSLAARHPADTLSGKAVNVELTRRGMTQSFHA